MAKKKKLKKTDIEWWAEETDTVDPRDKPVKIQAPLKASIGEMLKVSGSK